MQSASESGLACNVQANLALTSDSSELGKWIGRGFCLLLAGLGIKCACVGIALIAPNYFGYRLESKKLDQQVQLSSAK